MAAFLTARSVLVKRQMLMARIGILLQEQREERFAGHVKRNYRYWSLE
jgi:hypothetical protein